jgi:hypothetical protein
MENKVFSTNTVGSTSEVWDICDCDERCSRCGKKKKNPYTTYYPSYPWTRVDYPWITWTVLQEEPTND